MLTQARDCVIRLVFYGYYYGIRASETDAKNGYGLQMKSN